MSFIVELIEKYGLLVVFLNVLIEQLGAPLPAYPIMLVAGALAGGARFSIWMLVVVAVGAALIADYAWFWAGRRYGTRVMAMLCRISLSPDSCVRQTESIYLRFGPASLVVAKFIPGFASVASALAGATGTRRSVFLLADGCGALLWAGSAILLGSLFSSTVADLLGVLEELGKWGLMLLALGLGLFIAAKWWERYRFMKSLSMARISVEELNQLRMDGGAPLVVDVRSPTAQREGRIPGAVTIPDQEIDTFVHEVPAHEEVIVYCACPNEVSAARVAKMLMQRGYQNVRPLSGGIDAWVEAGYEIELATADEGVCTRG
ncbi:MAG TPA: DedA family protein/thiosulfate sulfurtransferase GlpE [Telluria sp.]|nr:DedA family protein/thiosulfate sulfurtransferase GlpE [Telluria sp.]